MKKRIKDLTKKEVRVLIEGRIENIIQTKGPTLFEIYDGSGSITVAGFFGPGKRAYPEINIGDYVSATISFIQGEDKPEIITMDKAEGITKTRIKREIAERINTYLSINKIEFLVKSEVLERLRKRMENAARLIKEAIVEKRPIIIRHHADTDGFCAGIALGSVITELTPDAWKYVKRVTSRTPFYSIEDAIKDIAYYVEWKSRNSDKKPLLILLDNGSTQEDLTGIKKVRIYGFKVIVVDHHNPGKIVIDEFVDEHINPHIVGGSGNITAGMLATELARFIKDDEGLYILPALSGIGDHSEGKEMNEYLQIAEKYGATKVHLEKISACIDFEAYYMSYTEGKGVIEDLLQNDFIQHTELVELLYSEVKQKISETKTLSKVFSEKKIINDIEVVLLDLEHMLLRGEYPPIGKATGIVFRDNYNTGKKLIVLGITENMCVVRASKETGFNLLEFLETIKHTGISGGGHELAGTVKYVKGYKDKVINAFLEYIKNLHGPVV